MVSRPQKDLQVRGETEDEENVFHSIGNIAFCSNDLCKCVYSDYCISSYASYGFNL